MFLLSLLLACPPAGEDVPLAAELTDVPTVVRVTWTDADAESGYVEWETEHGAFTTQAERQEDGSFEALLVGARPETAVTLTAVSGNSSQDASITTGAIEIGYPVLDAQDGNENPYFLVTTSWPDAPNNEWGPYILDPQGYPVWWYVDEVTPDLGCLRMRLDPAGEGVWIQRFGQLYSGNNVDEDSSIIHVDWDGTLLERVRLPTAHHDFYVEDDGALVYIEFDNRVTEEAEIWGDRIVRISADRQTEEVIWSTWDTFEPDGSADVITGLWTHANHLDWDGEAWMVGIRDLSSIVRVFDDGTVDWVVGPETGLLPDDEFIDQHGFDMLDNGNLVVFDNLGSRDTSRVLEFELDASAESANLALDYSPDPTLVAPILGDAIQADSGDIYGVFGFLGELHILDDSAQRVGWMRWETPTLLGYMTLAEGLGATEPAR